MSSKTPEELIPWLRQMIAVTLSSALERLGPAPDDCGEGVRAVLLGDDPVAFLALGSTLDWCVKADSWEGLKYQLDNIAIGQAKKRSKNAEIF